MLQHRIKCDTWDSGKSVAYTMNKHYGDSISLSPLFFCVEIIPKFGKKCLVFLHIVHSYFPNANILLSLISILSYLSSLFAL